MSMRASGYDLSGLYVAGSVLPFLTALPLEEGMLHVAVSAEQA